MRPGASTAGARVLLAGGILQVAWAAFVVWYSTGGHPTPTFFALALVGGAGVVLAFLAYAHARAGRARSAFVLGLVAALLPPLQVVTLVGAILCKPRSH